MQSDSEHRATTHGWWRPGVGVGGMVVAAFLLYWPCLPGGFVWDDDAWTTKLTVLFQNVSGLRAIWAWPTQLQQYYPLTATTFWLDYQAWRFWTVPYHVENVVLHLAAAGLFWRFLRRLEVRGAGLAAVIFLLHPLMVESVAWITERKNVLALSLFLAGLLAYGRFAKWWPTTPGDEFRGGRRAWGAWWLALGLFLAAYLAKATTFAFPAVVLLLVWWKRGRWQWREDVLPLLPFFAASIGFGLATAWLERNHLGARGPEWEIPFGERCVIAGRALWFYVGKLVCPADLCFIYPRWGVAERSGLNWLWPAAAVGALGGLWALRRRLGRGPLAAVLFFAGTLFPLLGFINGYFMRYSFVSDHWVYLPSLGLIALAAATATRQAELRPGLARTLGGAMLAGFATLTFVQSGLYRDAESLYRITLAKNPKADLAHNNLGLLLARAGQTDEALSHFEAAIALRPAGSHAHNNLANLLWSRGRTREAAEHFEAALKSEPDNPSTCNNLAMLLATSPEAGVRNGGRAVQFAERANRLTGGQNASVLGTLAAAYAANGQLPAAAATARAALRLASLRPGSPLARSLERQLQRYEAGSPAEGQGSGVSQF